MKKLIGYIPANLLYYVGDFTSKIMNYVNINGVYSFYNWSMTKSSDIQEWSGLKGPWEDITTKN